MRFTWHLVKRYGHKSVQPQSNTSPRISGSTSHLHRKCFSGTLSFMRHCACWQWECTNQHVLAVRCRAILNPTDRSIMRGAPMTLKPTCPHCRKPTPFESDVDYIFTARIKCTQCGEEFFIVKNAEMTPIDYQKDQARRILTK